MHTHTWRWLVVAFAVLIALGCVMDIPAATQTDTAAEPTNTPVEQAEPVVEQTEPAVEKPDTAAKRAALTIRGTATASKQEVLEALVENVLIPQQEAASLAFGNFAETARRLCDEPSPDNLLAARQDWRAARAAWMRLQGATFGPVEDRRSRMRIDWFPVDPERIEKTLAKRETISAHEVREFLSSTQQGLGALEYVLFADDTPLLADLARADSLRCDYLAALTEVAADETGGVVQAWTEGVDGEAAYAAVFTGGAPVSLHRDAAVDELVRTAVFLLRRLADMQLGAGLGVDGTDPDPEAVPGGAAGGSTADLRNQILGLCDIYLGSADPEVEAPGLGSLIAPLSEEVDQAVRDGFVRTLEALDAIDGPLLEAAAADPAGVQRVHDELKALQRSWNTDIVSLLGVSVGFSDTDGDSG